MFDIDAIGNVISYALGIGAIVGVIILIMKNRDNHG
jgi:hypothetical protein